MAVGKVKWYDKKKGYGFILSDAEKEVFVHYTSFSDAALRSLNDGEEVTFDVVPGEKGLRAQNVALIPEKKTAVLTNS